MIAVDGSASMVAKVARGPAATATRRWSPTWPSWSWTSRSTPSSRAPSSTGSSTTTLLFRRLRAALRPGGRLAAQCGGAGNIARLTPSRRRRSPPASPSRRYFEGFAEPWNYAGAEETEARLRARRLRRGPLLAAAMDGAAAGAARVHLRTVCLGAHVDRLPEELRSPSSTTSWRRAGSRWARLRAPQHRGRRRLASAPLTLRVPPDERRPPHSRPARRRDRPRDRRRRPAAAGVPGRVRVRRAADGRLLDRRPRHRPHRRGAGGLPRRRRGPARRRRRPQMGHHRPRRAAPRAGPARPAQGHGPLRQPAPGAAEPGPGRRQPAARGAHRRHRPAGRPRAHRRHLLRRPAAATATPPTTPASTRPRKSSGSPAPPSRRPAAAPRAPAASPASPRSTRPTCWRPRGSGARWSPHRPRLRRRRARPPAGRQRGDAAGLAPGRLRRDRHREPLRRHPQRRVGDADRLAGDAALRQPRRRRRPGPLRAGPRLGPGHRRQGHRQPAGDLPLGGDDAAPRPRPARGRRRGSRRRSTRSSSAACALRTSRRERWRRRRCQTSPPRSRSGPPR